MDSRRHRAAQKPSGSEKTKKVLQYPPPSEVHFPPLGKPRHSVRRFGQDTDDETDVPCTDSFATQTSAGQVSKATVHSERVKTEPSKNNQKKGKTATDSVHSAPVAVKTKPNVTQGQQHSPEAIQLTEEGVHLTHSKEISSNKFAPGVSPVFPSKPSTCAKAVETETGGKTQDTRNGVQGQMELAPIVIDRTFGGDIAALHGQFNTLWPPESYVATLVRGNTVVELTKPADHRNFRKYLEMKKVKFTVKEIPVKVFPVVIRGVPHTVTPQVIKDALTKKGYDVHVATNMSSRNKDPCPLFKVDLVDSEHSKGIVKELHSLLYYKVTVKPFQVRSPPPQCWKCLQYNCTARKCDKSPRCKFCGGHHSLRDCRRPRAGAASCALCGKPHWADSRQCQYFKDAMEAKYPRQMKKLQTQTQTRIWQED